MNLLRIPELLVVVVLVTISSIPYAKSSYNAYSYNSRSLLLPRQAATSCSDRANSRCPGSASRFCCPSSAECIPLENATSVICCPAGEDCSFILPIPCTDTSPKCEDKCCPLGYDCADGGCRLQEENKPNSYRLRDECAKLAQQNGEAGSGSGTCTELIEATKKSCRKACPRFPAKAIVAGFFPGLAVGAAIMFAVGLWLRNRELKGPHAISPVTQQPGLGISAPSRHRHRDNRGSRMEAGGGRGGGGTMGPRNPPAPLLRSTSEGSASTEIAIGYDPKSETPSPPIATAPPPVRNLYAAFDLKNPAHFIAEESDDYTSSHSPGLPYPHPRTSSTGRSSHRLSVPSGSMQPTRRSTGGSARTNSMISSTSPPSQTLSLSPPQQQARRHSQPPLNPSPTRTTSTPPIDMAPLSPVDLGAPLHTPPSAPTRQLLSTPASPPRQPPIPPSPRNIPLPPSTSSSSLTTPAISSSSHSPSLTARKPLPPPSAPVPATPLPLTTHHLNLLTSSSSGSLPRERLPGHAGFTRSSFAASLASPFSEGGELIDDDDDLDLDDDLETDGGALDDGSYIGSSDVGVGVGVSVGSARLRGRRIRRAPSDVTSCITDADIMVSRRETRMVGGVGDGDDEKEVVVVVPDAGGGGPRGVPPVPDLPESSIGPSSSR